MDPGEKEVTRVSFDKPLKRESRVIYQGTKSEWHGHEFMILHVHPDETDPERMPPGEEISVDGFRYYLCNVDNPRQSLLGVRRQSIRPAAETKETPDDDDDLPIQDYHRLQDRSSPGYTW